MIKIKDSMAYKVALCSWLSLIILGILWEWLLAPIRPGGSWLILKIIFLLMPVMGLIKQQKKGLQLACLVIWFYVAEGAVRAYSDPTSISRYLALTELLLCLIFFIAAILALKHR